MSERAWRGVGIRDCHNLLFLKRIRAPLSFVMARITQSAEIPAESSCRFVAMHPGSERQFRLVRLSAASPPERRINRRVCRMVLPARRTTARSGRARYAAAIADPSCLVSRNSRVAPGHVGMAARFVARLSDAVARAGRTAASADRTSPAADWPSRTFNRRADSASGGRASGSRDSAGRRGNNFVAWRHSWQLRRCA